MMQDVIQLQNRLHEALDAFLSGSILRSSRRILGRRLDELHPLWAQRLDEIAAMITDGSQPETVRLQHGAYRSAAHILSAGYHVLGRRIAGLGLDRSEESIISVTALTACGEGAREQALLEELQRYWTSRCEGQIRGLFVHGSYATQDTNAYSDLDALVIVNKAVVENAEELYRFGRVAIESYRCLLAADILQHHGHFVLTEIDLEYYCDAYFPQVLFGFAKELYASRPLAVRHVRESLPEAFLHLKKMCARFTSSWNRRELRLAYYLKLQLSSFMILPALLMQTLGRPCYKRESFALAKPLFTPAEWQAMDDVSELRRTWRQTDASAWKYAISTQPYLWSQVVRRFGRWGVPNRIWETVKRPPFQERLAVFAQKSLRVAEETLRSRGVARLD